MGIIGLIGKAAGSKVIEKVETEMIMKQNREQTSKYSNYIKMNMKRICTTIEELEGDTTSLIEEINIYNGVKLSFREKGNLRKIKEKATQNIQYLYLIRDFFTCLSKNASGILLKNEELMLVIKFAPFFDGVPVMNIDEDSDDSLMGEFKEIGQELKEAFISTKKKPTHFDFDEYLYRYDEKINEYILPDIKKSIESFNNVMIAQEVNVINENDEKSEMDIKPLSVDEIECPSCHLKIRADSKFCFVCGNKIEIDKPKFCSMCGSAIEKGGKFCSGCGSKIG